MLANTPAARRGANKNGKPVAPNEGARKNPVAPVAGTTNDGAIMQHEVQEAPDDTQAPPALLDELQRLERIVETGLRSMRRTRKNSTRKKTARKALPRNATPPCPPIATVDGATTPGDGTEVFEKTLAYIREYCSMTDDEATALALYTMGTYAIDAFDRFGYVGITAPSWNCGKSQVMDTLNALVANPYMVESCPPITLAEKVASGITLLYDEATTDKGLLNMLRKILNGGYKRGGKIGTRFRGVPADINTFGPKIFAYNAELPHDLQSRCIPINLQRLLPGEEVAEFQERISIPEAAPIREILAAWAKEFVIAAPTMDKPEEISKFHNRNREIVKPLLLIAASCGAGLLATATGAFLNLLTNRATEEEPGIKVLAAIRELFKTRSPYVDMFDTQPDIQKLYSKEIIAALGISEKMLGNILRKFGIHSKQINSAGRNHRGYYMSQFADAFARYLPAEESES